MRQISSGLGIIKGLGKFFRRHAATIIGTAIGGVLGMLAGYFIDKYLFPENSEKGLNASNEEEEKEMQFWFDFKVKPYLTEIFKGINNNPGAKELSDQKYINRINKIIISLAYAEMYYRTQLNTGLSALFDTEINLNKTNKAEVMFCYMHAIKESIIKLMEENGIKPMVKHHTVKSTDDIQSISPFIWEKKVAAKIEIFVLSGGFSPTKTNIMDQDFYKDEEGEIHINPLPSKRVLIPVDSKKQIKEPESSDPLPDSDQTEEKEEGLIEINTPTLETSIPSNTKKVPEWIMPAIGTTVIGIIIGKILK